MSSSCVVFSCIFDVDEVAYGSLIPPAAPRFRVDCMAFGVGSAVCNASPSLVSVVPWSRVKRLPDKSWV
jgi:hypothetical protein